MSSQWRGLGVCQGIAFGKIHMLDRRRVSVPHFHVSPEKRDAEVDRFKRALADSHKQLSEIVERAEKANLTQVVTLLSAHQMILSDEALRGATDQRICEDGQNAEWALQETVKSLKQLFDRLEHDYFRERRSDVDIVSDRIMRNLVGAETDLLDHLPENAVVMAYDFSPADTVALAKSEVRGFITERGGRTSHTAILARALGVPSVLGVHGIMDVAGSGDPVIVDGYVGEVILSPTEAALGRFRGVERRRQEEEQSLLRDRDLMAETTDGVQIELLGNIEVAMEIGAVVRCGGQGVGLYRTEFLYVECPDLADAESHYQAYRSVIEGMKGRPVTIRTLDVGDEKVWASLGSRDEEQSGSFVAVDDHRLGRVLNPALGLRAIRLSIREPSLFREQLKGILLASAHGIVRLLLPLITQIEELRQVKALLSEVMQELDRDGREYDENIAVGVMVETPAAAMIADLLAEEADFFSIGTNDLIQYSLATDRRNEDVSYLYQPCHPAVLRMVKSICQAAEATNTPVSLCGEMASDPFHAPLLIGAGLRSLSMTATSIPLVKRMIRKLSVEECTAFLEEATTYPTAADVERELATRLRSWTPDLFGGV